MILEVRWDLFAFKLLMSSLDVLLDLLLLLLAMNTWGEYSPKYLDLILSLSEVLGYRFLWLKENGFILYKLFKNSKQFWKTTLEFFSWILPLSMEV